MEPFLLIFLSILTLIVSYLIIRLAVTHALKSHSRWVADGSLERETAAAAKLKADRDYVAGFEKRDDDR